jgi:hypothetical protein
MELISNTDPTSGVRPSPPATDHYQTWGRAMLDALADAREILAAPPRRRTRLTPLTTLTEYPSQPDGT